MKNVFSNVLECIGNTPLIRINRLNPNRNVILYGKLESSNPGGSIKDRAALSMIEAAERSEELTPDKIIIEATSGNTGIGLATVAAVKGYRIVLAMPETASMERQKILKALGAELLLTPGALATDGAIEEVYRLVREHPERYFMADQFNNNANPDAHYYGTGPEIYEQTEGRVNVVVCTLGTSGTAMGLLHAMKERNPDIQVVAVEPYQGHKIQGLKNMKESYVPGIFDRHALDRIVRIKDEDAFETSRRLAREEGLFVGMSSGAAVAAAIKIAETMEEGIVVAVLPDGGERYLSTNLFTTMLEPDFKFFDFLQRTKTDFKPVREGKARLLITGPPLNHPLTLNQSRRFLLADLLVRFLKAKGFGVNPVVLIPDLDSKTIHGAIEAGLPLADYVKQRFHEFRTELRQLGVDDSFDFPTASEHVDTIVHCTRKLLNTGRAYEKLRSVYFNLAKSEDYGALSRIDTGKIRVGSTVDLSAYEKLNPRDFTLLKRTNLAELKSGFYLKTDWGNVIPTWHISAAAVALGSLGSPVDIQVSSVDFLFPHLDNLKAIGDALTGKNFANVWMLCERIWFSKNDARTDDFGEQATIHDLLGRGYKEKEVRYWILSTHYRKSIQGNLANLDNSIRGFRRIQEFISRIQYTESNGEEHPLLPEMVFALEQNFFDALADDLNMPQALAALFKFIRGVNPVLDSQAFNESQRSLILTAMSRLNSVMGLFDLELKPLSGEQRKLLEQRAKARAASDWAEADRLRDALRAQGLIVVDTPQGTRLKSPS